MKYDPRWRTFSGIVIHTRLGHILDLLRSDDYNKDNDDDSEITVMMKITVMVVVMKYDNKRCKTLYTSNTAVERPSLFKPEQLSTQFNMLFLIKVKSISKSSKMSIKHYSF